DIPLGPYEIAQLAYQIERGDLGLSGGKQDQYAAAFGGVNFTEFLPGRAGVIVNPLRLRPDVLKEFESSLVICFSGQSRLSSDIIEAQVRGLDDMDAATLESMHAIKRHAVQMKSQLVAGHIRDMARALHESWLAKKATARQVSSSSVETLLTVALDAGAWAGKVSGAGGGGFIMLLVDPSRRYGLIRALNAAGGDASAVKLTFEGVEAWWAPA
ncbi:MAG: dehydrogenase, partial [Alphaproteobacteria bacterium]|nr:dehydrogenase [Alphaproteobacteria bacterium]